MRLNIKNKIKSFFEIPKEDLKEELSPVFEKVTLFTLTKNKLFLGVLFFLLIVNIFVGFDINQLYIRAILSFIFLITIPGLLIMLMLKIREVGFWEYLVYVVGLSVSFIMFGGLAVNWILPWLNITDNPLSLWPILICFNIFLIAFWIIAYIRNKDFKSLNVQYPKLDTINRIFFVVPMLFPILSILGAFLLNNHGTNILTMMMIGGIAVYVFAIVLLRKRLNSNIYLWALYLIGLSLLLMFSIRSWYVLGWDIFQEQLVSQLADRNLNWDILNFKDSYNACLSISILPQIFNLFLKINNQFIFKFLIQILFGFVPMIIFLISTRYANKVLSFLSSFLFVFLVGFLEMAQLIRQEIAFIFFGLMLLILFTKKLNPTLKKILFLIFSISMMISHYSTSYIVLSVFTITYISVFIFEKFKREKTITFKKKHSKRERPFLTFLIILLLLIFGFLWYSQITQTSSGLTNTFKDSINKMNKIFSEELTQEGSSLLSQFNLFYEPKDLRIKLDNYIQESTLKYTNDKNIVTYFPERYSLYNTRLILDERLPIKIDHNIIIKIYLIERFLKILIKLFILIGIFNLILIQIKNQKINLEYVFLSLGFSVIILVVIILPILSINYPLGRLYQQSLILLSLPSIFGGLIFLRIFKNNLKLILLTFLLVLLLLFSSGFIPQLTGGANTPLQLNNFGGTYDSAYSHSAEIYSARWLTANYNNKNLIYADFQAKRRLVAFATLDKSIIDEILPSTIDKNSYIYSNYANKIKQKTFKGNFLTYNFPTKFLNDNKNKVYNNGGSEIFK